MGKKIALTFIEVERPSDLKYHKIFFIFLLLLFVILFRTKPLINHYSYNQLFLSISSFMVEPSSEELLTRLNQIEAVLPHLNERSASDKQQIARLQGYYYHFLDMPNKAQEAWEEAKISTDFFLWQSDRARGQQEYDEAFQWLNYGSYLYPKSSGYPYRIGLINEDLNNWHAAIEAYENAIKLDSLQNVNQSHLYYRLAINYHRREGYQNLEKALDAYNKAISLNTFTSLNDLADAHYGRGDIRLILGNAELAIQDFEIALHTNPNHEWAHLMLGKEMQNLEGAEGAAQQHLLLALENWSNESNLYVPLLALGEFYCKVGKIPPGLDAYQEAYAAKGDHVTDNTIEDTCAVLNTK